MKSMFDVETVKAVNCADTSVSFELPWDGRVRRLEIAAGEEIVIPEEWTKKGLTHDGKPLRPSALEQYAPQLCVCSKEDTAKIKAHKAWLKKEAERTAPKVRGTNGEG